MTTARTKQGKASWRRARGRDDADSGSRWPVAETSCHSASELGRRTGARSGPDDVMMTSSPPR